MTSTSFNPIQLQQTSIQPNQPMQLKQGQVFHGTVKQLYPDQMAEIQIGNQKMFAKLEIPLKAGDAHYFQVTAINPQTELKVVSGPMASTLPISQQIQTLVDSLQLPKSIEMKQILAHFLKSSLPMSKDQLVQAEMWMKTLPEGLSKQDALTALQRMTVAKMPFTNDVFKALLYGSKTEGMSHSLQNLIQQLQSQTGLSESVKANLMTQLEKIQSPFDSEKGGFLLARTVQTLLDASQSTASKLEAFTILKQSTTLPNNAANLNQSTILPNNATIQNWQSSIISTNTSSNGLPSSVSSANAGQLIQTISSSLQSNPQLIDQVKTWVSNQSLLTGSQKNELFQLIQQFEGTTKTTNQVNQFTNQLQQQFIKMFSNNTTSQVFMQDEFGYSSKDQLLSLFKPDVSLSESNAMLRNMVKMGNESMQPFVQNILTEADALLQSTIDSKSMTQAVKNIFHQLGISYEAQLANKATNIQEIAQSLKSQLLSLLQDSQTPTALREAAEQLVARLNGMQLLSSENGHQHQLIMQLPLHFFGRQMDATLQWNGRMKEDGKIDANFARVLFYLNMQSLSETVIDMQVQNRIVTLNIYNDNEQLDSLAEPLKQSLKNGLESIDYQLSGVIIKPFTMKTTVAKNSQLKKEQNRNETGVDIRI